jgi:hypothetical protein
MKRAALILLLIAPNLYATTISCTSVGLAQTCQQSLNAQTQSGVSFMNAVAQLCANNWQTTVTIGGYQYVVTVSTTDQQGLLNQYSLLKSSEATTYGTCP